MGRDVGSTPSRCFIEDIPMTGNFVAFVVLSVLGFVIGGLVGWWLDSSWYPDCMYGILIVWVAALGGGSSIDLFD